MDRPAGPACPRVRSAPARPVSWRTVAQGSALEFVLAAALLFGVTTIVRWIAGASPVSAAIPELHVQLVLIGACVGPLLAGLILAGKASGGHINPAISIAMWRFGLFPGVAVGPYIAAQLAGSVVGTLAGRAAWAPAVARPPVFDASLQPGRGWSAVELFAGEAISMGLIILLVGLFLAVPRLAPLVPWLVGFLIGAAIAVLGTTTGGSDNPARQFGPAIVSGRLSYLWIYLVAPLTGAVLACWVRKWLLSSRFVRKCSPGSRQDHDRNRRPGTDAPSE
jgi:glycerol uptake facilitator-like aquaporin